MKTDVPSVVRIAQEKYDNISVIVSVFTLRIVWADEDFAQRLGYTQEELIGLPAVKITDLKPADAFKEATRLFTTHGKESKPVITKSGEALYMTTKIHALMYDKEPHIIVTDLVFDEDKQQ